MKTTTEETIVNRIKEELQPIDINEMYDDLLNGYYDKFEIAGIEFEPARSLKILDEIAYECGQNDYLDSMVCDNEIEEIDGDYYWKEEIDGIREEERKKNMNKLSENQKGE